MRMARGYWCHGRAGAGNMVPDEPRKLRPIGQSPTSHCFCESTIQKKSLCLYAIAFYAMRGVQARNKYAKKPITHKRSNRTLIPSIASML